MNLLQYGQQLTQRGRIEAGRHTKRAAADQDDKRLPGLFAQLKAAVTADEPAIAAAALKALDDALSVIATIAVQHGL